jgi:hypothetical protein
MLRHEWQILDNFKKFLSIKVIKIVFDSMLYETHCINRRIENWIYRIKCGTKCCWQISTLSNDCQLTVASGTTKGHLVY